MREPSALDTPGVSLPRRLARWQHLVTPVWLDALSSGRPVDAAPAAAWRLLEVGCGGRDDFEHGHIRGAGYLETCRLEQGPTWNKVPDPDLLRVLLQAGIRHDTTVVLYGRNTLAAARAAHLMLYAGVRDVRLLDGGLAAWQAAGRALSTLEPEPHAAARDFGAPFPAHPEYLVDVGQVKALIAQQESVLVSIRTRPEFTGQDSGYPYIDAKGEIPGARWGRAGHDGDVNSMSDFHRPDGTMREPAEIQAFWDAEGIHPRRPTVFYCGTGWRASLAFFYAWLMDWERISVYDGGWCEWSRLHAALTTAPSP